MFDEIVYNVGGVEGRGAWPVLLTGPDYHGPIPANMTEIKVRTRFAVVANRVFVNGEADLPGAREAQAGIPHAAAVGLPAPGAEVRDTEVAIQPRLAFVPAAPEPLRLFEQIGFGMALLPVRAATTTLTRWSRHFTTSA